MRIILHTIAWIRMARRCLSRSAQLILVLLTLPATAYARENTKKVNLHQLLQKHAIKGLLPRPELPVVTSGQTSCTRRADAEQLEFTDRVWFPGEWEEVKAGVEAWVRIEDDNDAEKILTTMKRLMSSNAFYRNITDTLSSYEWGGKPVSKGVYICNGKKYAVK